MPVSLRRPSSPLLRVACFLLFAAVVSLVYFGPYLRNFFVYDDYFFLERAIQGPARLLIGYNDNLRIVSNAVWMPLYSAFALDPFGYNLFSLALYLANAGILYWLCELMFADRRLSFLAAGFFVAGSVGADAVFWRGASATLVSAGLYLLALCAYLLYRQRSDATSRYLSLGLFVLAIFSKEEAASLPFIIIVMELLLFKDRLSAGTIARHVLPYCAIVAFYAGMNYLIIYQLLDSQSFMSGVAKFRPLYSLFAGWAVFFLPPHGALAPDDPLIYLTAAGIPLSFFLVKDRRFLLFAYLWIALTFLPQSLSGQSQFSTTSLLTSISRHLYLPSIGSSLALALLLVSIRDRWPFRWTAVLSLAVCSSYLVCNLARVHERGDRWAHTGESMAIFLRSMRQSVPCLPDNTYFCVNQSPVGRSFMQAAVRTAYRNPRIYWMDSDAESQLPPDCSLGIFMEFNRDDAARPVTVLSAVQPD